MDLESKLYFDFQKRKMAILTKNHHHLSLNED